MPRSQITLTFFINSTVSYSVVFWFRTLLKLAAQHLYHQAWRERDTICLFFSVVAWCLPLFPGLLVLWNNNLLQYSCLENSHGQRSWWATVYGITEESDTTEHLSAAQHACQFLKTSEMFLMRISSEGQCGINCTAVSSKSQLSYSQNPGSLAIKVI